MKMFLNSRILSRHALNEAIRLFMYNMSVYSYKISKKSILACYVLWASTLVNCDVSR